MSNQHILSNTNAWLEELAARAREAGIQFTEAVVKGEPYTALWIEWQACRHESALIESARNEINGGVTASYGVAMPDMANVVKSILEQKIRSIAAERVSARFYG